MALSDEESERRKQAQRHVLKLSREGQVDKVRQILDDNDSDEYLHVDWMKALLEAAVDSPKMVRREMVWTLSERYSACSKTREELCDLVLDE